MKIGDRKEFFPTGIVVIDRADGDPIEIKVRGLPLDFGDHMLEIGGPVPEAPKGDAVRDASGKPVRDSSGAVIRQPKTNDVEYQKALNEYGRVAAGVTLLFGLYDETVKFDAEIVDVTKPFDAGRAKASALSIIREMGEAGFTLGDVMKIASKIQAISNVEVEIKNAENF